MQNRVGSARKDSGMRFATRDALESLDFSVSAPASLHAYVGVALRRVGLCHTFVSNALADYRCNHHHVTPFCIPHCHSTSCAADVYKKATRIMAEKSFTEAEKDEKKRSVPPTGESKDEN